jgi:hypothetical protein
MLATHSRARRAGSFLVHSSLIALAGIISNHRHTFAFCVQEKDMTMSKMPKKVSTSCLKRWLIKKRKSVHTFRKKKSPWSGWPWHAWTCQK